MACWISFWKVSTLQKVFYFHPIIATTEQNSDKQNQPGFRLKGDYVYYRYFSCYSFFQHHSSSVCLFYYFLLLDLEFNT